MQERAGRGTPWEVPSMELPEHGSALPSEASVCPTGTRTGCRIPRAQRCLRTQPCHQGVLIYSPTPQIQGFILQLHKSRGFACCVFPLPQQLSLIPPKNSHSFPRKTHRPPALTFPPCPQHQSSVNSPGQGHPTVTGPKDL